MKIIKLFIIAGLFLICLMISPFTVHAVPRMIIDIPEGQNNFGLNDEFYVGRCARVDVLFSTEGQNISGMDLLLDYDPSKVSLVAADCTTSASVDDFVLPATGNANSFDTYVNKSINTTSGRITLAGLMNIGRYINIADTEELNLMSFYILINNDQSAADFTLVTSPTPAVCKLSTASGNILQLTINKTINDLRDTDTPQIVPLIPIADATVVNVNQTISLNLLDDQTGINISSSTIDVNGVLYQNSTSPIYSYQCDTTNYNRVYQCRLVVDPGLLNYDTVYSVTVNTTDQGFPTIYTSQLIYQFTTETDILKPTVSDYEPTGSGIDVDSLINFTLEDRKNTTVYGTGLNVNNLQITVSSSLLGTINLNCSDSRVTCTPTTTNGITWRYDISLDLVDFSQNDTVIVQIQGAQDIATVNGVNQPNIMDTFSWSFTTDDTTDPQCTTFTPERNSAYINTTDSINFTCTDISGSGIDLNSVFVMINGIEYQNPSSSGGSFTYSGSSQSYTFRITPAVAFSSNYAFEVLLGLYDYSGNDNVYTYGLATATSTNTNNNDDCNCEDCDDDDDDDDDDEDDAPTATPYIINQVITSAPRIIYKNQTECPTLSLNNEHECNCPINVKTQSLDEYNCPAQTTESSQKKFFSNQYLYYFVFLIIGFIFGFLIKSNKKTDSQIKDVE